MKTKWDYTNLADAYLKRPDYSEEAIDEMIKRTFVEKEDLVCDIGAGTAHLTLMLANRGLNVVAVEPNDAMRINGMKRTANIKSVIWHEGVGENTNQEDNSFNLVTFGSSFNVTDRSAALEESYRILKKEGWFACMWNHRDLDDEIQFSIEKIIKKYIENYNYGTRREDQTEIIKSSNLFKDIQKIEGKVYHREKIEDCIEGWKSHATLYRQAGDKFNSIIGEIEKYLHNLNKSEITIPYTTRIWIAKADK
ncbi:MAG: class I SAM-dependent methyltransferase [Clostridium beijerinckii]|nr:class I SAM-dependent methyltransferase [Clostridium beijerinckii]